jgi:hypothetical protein
MTRLEEETVEIGAVDGRLVFPSESWSPATLEDALAIARDVELRGYAVATPDGRRLDPPLAAVHG